MLIKHFHSVILTLCFCAFALTAIGQVATLDSATQQPITIAPELGYSTYQGNPLDEVHTFSIYDFNPRFGKLAIDPPMQSNLELVPDQIRAIDELRAVAINDLNTLLAKATAQNPRPNPELLKEDVREISRVFCNGIERVLLEHQKLHLALFPRIVHLQRYGLGEFVESGAGLTGSLQLSPEQREELKQKMTTMRHKLRQRLQQLEMETVKELVSELDSDQQKGILQVFESLPNQRVPDFKWFFSERDCTTCGVSR